MKETSENRAGWFARLRDGLTRTRHGLRDRIIEVLSVHNSVDDDLCDELEEVLIEADVGAAIAMELIERARNQSRRQKIKDVDEFRKLIETDLVDLLGDECVSSNEDDGPRPRVVLVAGVNGSGKTTTIGKLANRLSEQGRHVLLAAADTFRAAAIDQLGVWSERVGADLIRHKPGADPAAVAHDAADAAVARGVDYLIVDTAGRLHTQVNLMEELKKIQRVLAKRIEGAPHDVLLVLDATTGQNGLSQAKLFAEALDVTGIVLTKLDGTAKGGIVFAIRKELGIPVKYIGVGESIEDLHEFDPSEFATALFG
ncbi:MAG: signal recognition particle-docking protein FtsY [Candidatus Hydrogenedentes bacterium]|nr:signal recognition particle-docking protein FtsY [Candidatus Hydrogenedentota bacterium]